MLCQCLIRRSTFKANYFYDLIFVRLSKLITIYDAFICIFVFLRKTFCSFITLHKLKTFCHAWKYNVNKGFLTILSNVLSTLLMFFPTILFLCFFFELRLIHTWAKHMFVNPNDVSHPSFKNYSSKDAYWFYFIKRSVEFGEKS